MAVRGIRGATHLAADDRAEMGAAVIELMTALLERNGLHPDDLISVIFTCTADLRSDFPAASARSLGLGAIPLLCATEIDVPGALERVVRVMVLAETDRPKADVVHVYLRGAEVLRRDLAQ